ncbi:hypothetical protein A1Q2_08199 [Trichosporon asahii var. asahii CBS 8904]|uniref:Uncharacterized protein n=1 Tax=Trichosporon asahii var. asahii (strain CBS 8904) TaxID=1220162 RepID=K1VL26_TRIAC|nr:hypothetical protein A1Q2_08199 [Trichosporon asahii var. asahii CBS 8904]
MLGPTPPAKTRFETCEKAVKGVCGSPQAIITASQWLKANSKLSNFSASADYQRLVSPLLVLPESMRLPVSKSQHQRHEIRRRQLHNVAKILVRYQETGEPITIGGATAMPWASLVPQLDHETIRAFFHAPASTFDSMTSLFEFTKSLTLKIDGIAYVLNPANVKTFRLWWEPNAQGGAMSDLRVKLMNVGGYAGFGTGIRLLDGYGSFHVPPELQDSTAHGKKDKLSVVARAMFLALLSIEEGGSSEKSSLRSTAWYLLKFDQPFSTPPELATIMKHFVVPQTNGPKEKAAKRYFAECLSGWQADDWQPDHPATVTDLIETNPLSEFLVNLPALDCFELLRRSLGAQSIDDAHAEERLLANSALIAESGCTVR